MPPIKQLGWQEGGKTTLFLFSNALSLVVPRKFNYYFTIAGTVLKNI